MSDESITPVNPRGTIIVDASALVVMSLPLSNEFLTNDAIAQKIAGGANLKEICLIDMLKLLARHGYEILIPEMVAYESAGILRDGKSINDYFPRDAVTLLKKPGVDFLKEVGNNFYPNIKIVAPPEQDSSKPASYIRELFRIHNQTSSAYDKRREIVALEGRTNHYGDIAAYEFIAHMPLSAVPIFYLSDDKGALKKMANLLPAHDVNLISSSGLYEALRKKSGLLPTIGITDEHAYQALFIKYIDPRRREIRYREKGPTIQADMPVSNFEKARFGAIPDTIESDEKTTSRGPHLFSSLALDSPPTIDIEAISERRPFEESISEIEIPQPTRSESYHENSRVDRFRRKFPASSERSPK